MRSYVTANATGSPAKVVVGSGANSLTVTRDRFQLPAVTATPDQTVAPSALDPDVFALWPATAQNTYFSARATGVAPHQSLILGLPGAQVRLASSGGTLVAEPVPSAYATPPDQLAASTFLSWPPVFREAYVRDNLRGAQTALAIGPQGAQITASFTGGSTLVIAGGTLQPTPGQDASLIPYYYLPGSGVGASSPQVQAIADKLYPALTGDPSIAGSTIPDSQKPAAFTTAPANLDPAEFSNWHSAVQLEYVRRNGSGTPPALTIGASVANATPVTALVASPVAPATTGTRLYVVESLTKQDIGKMPLADQTALAALPAFATLSRALGLTTNATAATGILDAAYAVIASPGGKLDPTGKTMVDGAMPADDKKLFTDQIDIIKSQLSSQALFSIKDVQDKINTVMTRFARANAFSYNVNGAGKAKALSVTWSAPTITAVPATDSKGQSIVSQLSQLLYDAGSSIDSQGNIDVTKYMPMRSPSDYYTRDSSLLPAIDPSDPSKSPVNGETKNIQYKYVLDIDRSTNPPRATYATVTFGYTASVTMGSGASLDANAAITSGYRTFIAQESQIRDLAVKQQLLATTGANGSKQLDVPTLVFLFQLYANLTGEAVVRAETEEVNQTNALLQAYAVVQRIINRTVATITNPNASDPQIANITAQNDQEKAALRMFNNYNGNTFPEESPIERLKGITRPKSNLNLDPVTGKTASQWQATASQFSDTVTLLNQESQLKMNNINSITKQKDRNFDLANNAVAKSNEIIQKIASIG